MEKEKPNLQEITAIKNPRQAFFLTNNHAVINGESGCSIVDVSPNKKVKKISEDVWECLSAIHFSEQNRIINMAFHPNSAYIAIILENSCREDKPDKQIFIKYLETKKNDTFTTIKKENIITKIDDDSIDFTIKNNPSSLSFDCYGKYALITLYNKCFHVPVPFNVVYQDDAKERTTLLHWLLKNYPVDNTVLPDDIRTIITQIFLEMLKR